MPMTAAAEGHQNKGAPKGHLSVTCSVVDPLAGDQQRGCVLLGRGADNAVFGRSGLRRKMAAEVLLDRAARKQGWEAALIATADQ
ncbi:hypothetical protein B296_00017422 [Ensete ventricosum]|uniref:Uncharacterized protein n=1 Tax=Ensete ventricosum TaxID=4639 RepID=A0A427AYT4_ENSVE|nr:hypothetical protein B296_00017422 [Ensete ventricosum]